MNADGTSTAKQPTSPVPLRAQRFTDEQMKDGSAARQLVSQVDEIHKSTLAARSNLRNQSIVFENAFFDAARTPTSEMRFSHKFGTKVRWSVVRWVQPTTGTITDAGIYEPNKAPGQQGSQEDMNVLVLRPIGGVLGVADIEVWSAG